MSVIDIVYLGVTDGETPEGRVTYTQMWRVTTNNRLDGPVRVRAARGIPIQGLSTYNSGNEGDSNALCSDVSCHRVSDIVRGNIKGTVWEVTAEFGGGGGNSGGPSVSTPEEMFGQDPKVSWNSVKEAVYPLKDLDDKWFLNSAKQWFENRPPQFVNMQELRATRAEPNYDYWTANANVWSVNSENWYGSEKHYVRFSNVSSVAKWSDQFQFFYAETTYVFHFREADGDPFHPLQLPNIGFLHITDDDELVIPEDDLGAVHTGLRLLDENGKAMPQGEERVTYEEFRVYKLLNFNQIIRSP